MAFVYANSIDGLLSVDKIAVFNEIIYPYH